MSLHTCTQQNKITLAHTLKIEIQTFLFLFCPQVHYPGPVFFLTPRSVPFLVSRTRGVLLNWCVWRLWEGGKHGDKSTPLLLWTPWSRYVRKKMGWNNELRFVCNFAIHAIQYYGGFNHAYTVFIHKTCNCHSRFSTVIKTVIKTQHVLCLMHKTAQNCSKFGGRQRTPDLSLIFVNQCHISGLGITLPLRSWAYKNSMHTRTAYNSMKKFKKNVRIIFFLK